MSGECPDGGTCHHDCELSCWRVATCLPLTASGWDNWPEKVKAANPPVPRFENVLIEPSAEAIEVALEGAKMRGWHDYILEQGGDRIRVWCDGKEIT